MCHRNIVDCILEEPSSRDWPEIRSPLQGAHFPILERANAPERIELGRNWLTFCRYVTLRCNKEPETRPDELLNGDASGTRWPAWICILDWIKFLLEPGTKSFHFEETRSKDTTFYNGLRPKPKMNDTSGWNFPLPWLEHPEHLTIAELEVALAVFAWDGSAPDFAWWVKMRPYLLHRIHLFCLQRYCFPLLRALRKARKRKEGKEAELDAPPYRAMEQEWINWRLTGFVAIGMLAVLGLEFPAVFFFAGFFWNLPVFLLCIALGCLLWSLIQGDVFKQNKPLLADRRHARSRTLRLLLETLLRSAIFGLFAVAFWKFAEDALRREGALERIFRVPSGEVTSTNFENLVWPYIGLGLDPSFWLELWRHVTGFCALVLSAAVLGFLVQGFWEETSVLEPI